MAIIMKGSYDTEVFVAAGGHIGIKQADPLHEVDTLILLSPAQLPLLINELQSLYEKRAAWEHRTPTGLAPEDDLIDSANAQAG